MRLLLLHAASNFMELLQVSCVCSCKKWRIRYGIRVRRKERNAIINGNAFYEIDLECVKKKKQCAQTVHPEKKTDRINSRNMKDKDNIRQHE